MKHELKKIENSAVEIKMCFTAEELAPIKTTILEKIASEVEIPGFRKGHAPLNKVESEFAEKVKEEVVESVLKSHFGEVITAEKISPVSHIFNLEADMKDGLEMTFNIEIYPEFTLGKYKGLEVQKETFEPSDEQLNKEIDELLISKSKLVDAPEGHKAVLGDTVDLAFEGFVDGTPFEGGKADSHQLKLGTKMFIDTFEDQLVGYTVGQEGDIVVNFPKEYHAENLAGKPATFKVKVNAIKVLEKPELTDELAKELGFESVADLKNKKAEEIKDREEVRIKNEFISKLLQKIVSETKMEIPRSMVVREVENRMGEMNQQLSRQGISFEQYLQMIGLSHEQMYNQIAPMALNKVQVDLILNAIIKAENIEVSQEEFEAKSAEIAIMYGMTKEQLKEELVKNSTAQEFENSLKNEIASHKAVDLIVANSK